ncbi:MAG: Wzz/FepE/Etk N-terminal domain-containing protein [Chryseolinea sp.]
MVKTPNQSGSSDEIDLLDLLLRSVIVIRDNFWMIVLFFILGTSIGVAYFMATKKQYESKMIVSSSILTASYAKVLFDNVNGHLRDSDYDLLGKDLSISADEAKQIATLTIENLTKSDVGELKESDRYLITARVYDQRVLPALQKGLVSLLEHNEFVRIRVEQQRGGLTQMLSAVDRELADMQRFKEEIVSGKFFGSVKGNVMFDPTSVNSKIIELTQRKIEINNSLELINSVQLIEGFTAFKHHVKPSLAISIVGGSFLGLFAVGALIAFKSIRHLLRMAKANDAKHAA